MLVQIEFNGSPYVGVFARASDDLLLLPPSVEEDVRKEVGEALEATPVVTTMGGGTILGALCVMNSHGAVVTGFARDHEVRKLEDAGLEVAHLPGRYNAAGNNVLVNDHGALVNPNLEREAVEVIEETLDVAAATGTVAGLSTVGSAACVTARGALCHPKATDEELDLVEDVLGVEADIGTVNHGAPYIGAGLVANTHGAGIGRLTTGPEMNRIEDALGYLD